MSKTADVSPVGWYVGTYQLRLVELADRRKNDLQRRFLCWENTVLIKARTMREAHRKLVSIGESHTEPYKGGSKAVDVQWLFEGVIELLPVYEEIEDGAEIMWAEKTRTLQSMKKRVRKVGSVRAAYATRSHTKKGTPR